MEKFRILIYANFLGISLGGLKTSQTSIQAHRSKLESPSILVEETKVSWCLFEGYPRETN